MILGAIIGDIMGADFRRPPASDRPEALPPLRDHASFTDDSVCTIAVADLILNDMPIAPTIRAWCGRFPNRGYGPMFERWVNDWSMPAYESYGNGAVMRISPAAFLSESLPQALERAHAITAVSHNHPESLRGAKAITLALWLLRQRHDVVAVVARVEEDYGYDVARTPKEWSRLTPCLPTTEDTVAKALACVLKAEDFDDALRLAMNMGGDLDTLGAVTGALAEARFEGLSAWARDEALARLPQEMVGIVEMAYERAGRSLGVAANQPMRTIR
jgi:ADP-ribosylglycohydrolase